LRSVRILRATADRLRVRCEEGIGPLEAEACGVLEAALGEAREASRRAWLALDGSMGSPAGVR
jgi:hypothetical protein